MKISRYLVVEKAPNSKPKVRVTTNLPALGQYEVSMELDLDLPDELFVKPMLSASITIPSESVMIPTIDTEVVENIKELVSQELGVKLSIAVVEPE